MKDQFFKYIENLQDSITSKLEEIDGSASFKEDIWKRPEGGGGRTRVIENGAVFEKGGVNISGVHGKLPASMQAYFKVGDVDFFACGLSLVLHPKNPMAPTFMQIGVILKCIMNKGTSSISGLVADKI